MLKRDTRSSAGTPIASTDPARQLEPVLDAVHVRNYDHRAGHSVQMTLAGLVLEAELTDRSYVGPGQSARVSGHLEPGQYRLRVDGVERHRADYQLDETPVGTAVVELGNGVVRVTEGA